MSATAPLSPSSHAALVPSTTLERVARLFGVDVPNPTVKTCFDAIIKAARNNHIALFQQAPNEIEEIALKGIEEASNDPEIADYWEALENIGLLTGEKGQSLKRVVPCNRARPLAISQADLDSIRDIFSVYSYKPEDQLKNSYNAIKNACMLHWWYRFEIANPSLINHVVALGAPNSEEVARVLNQIGHMWFSKQKYENAYACFEQIVMMLEGRHPLSEKIVGNSSIFFGISARMLGKPKQALRVFQKIQTSQCPPHLTPHLFENIAFLLKESGKVVEAIPYFAQAYKAYLALGNNERAALLMDQLDKGDETPLQTIARLFSVNKPIPTAKDCFEAIKIAGKGKKGIPFQKAPREALDRLIEDELKEVRRHSKGKEKNLAVILINIGNGWFAAKEFQKALPFHIEALASLQKFHHPSTNHPDFLIANHNIGSSYVALQNWGKALFYMDAAAEVCKVSSPQSYEAAQALYNLAEVQAKLGHHQAALKNFEEAHLFFIQHNGEDDRISKCESEIDLLRVLIATAPQDERKGK